MTTRETAMVQLGPMAGFVGAHFWNFLNELHGSDYGADLLDTGMYIETSKGFRPRTVLIDVKGSLGSRPIYEENKQARPKDYTNWEGNTAVFRQDRIISNSFQRGLREDDGLDGQSSVVYNTPEEEGSTEYWTDYCKEVFSDRSIAQLPGSYVQGGVAEYFTEGLEVLAENERENVLDIFRWQAEQSDHLSGIIALCESDTGFTGIADTYLTVLKDEYPEQSLLIVGCTRQREEQKQDTQNVNEAWLAATAMRIDAQFVPFGSSGWNVNTFPHYQVVDPSIPFYASSLQAVGLELLTLPFRRRGGIPLSGLISALRGLPAWRISRSDIIFPMSATSRGILENDATELRTLTPSMGVDFPDLSAVRASRRVLTTRGVDLRSDEALRDQLVDWKFQYTSSSALPIPVPFPKQFGARVNKTGKFLSDEETNLRVRMEGRSTGFECERCTEASVTYSDQQSGSKAASSWSRELRLASRKLTGQSQGVNLDHAYVLEISETFMDLADDYTDY